MILLIFGIYAMIAANLRISRHYGLKGKGACIAGAICTAFALGFFSIFSGPIMAISQALGFGKDATIAFGLILQFVVLFMVLFALVDIYGNAFAKTVPLPMTKEEQSASLDQIRWFQVVYAILMPYIAIPWGIVNLRRGRRRSGILLVVVSIIVIVFVLIWLVAQFYMVRRELEQALRSL